METTTLAHALHKAFIMGGRKPFLGYSKASASLGDASTLVDEYSWLSFDEVLNYCLLFADGLREVGIPSRSCVGICAENTIEWLITDFASCFNDYVVVGVHSAWEERSLCHVLNTSCTVCVVCNENDIERFVKASVSCPSLRYILAMDSINLSNSSSAYSRKVYPLVNESLSICWMTDILFSQKSIRHLRTLTGAGCGIPSWFGLCNDASPEEADEPYTLLYTSGTTGMPKGVSVSKRRWLMDAQSNAFPGQAEPAVVSYMSLAHGGDRGICWQACFGGARVGMASNSDLTKFLAQVRAIKPTFFLGMSHLWCECYAVYKRELEVATVQAISRNLKIRGAFIQQYESIQDVDALDELSHTLVHTSFAASPHGGIPAPSTSTRDPEGVDQTAITFDVCLTAARALKGWDSFVDSMAKLLGIKDMLLLDWYDRFGGRVFIPVTGGGHTSDEVLAWMNAVFMPPTSTLKDQSSRVKNAYGLSEFPGISVNGVVNANIELELVPVPEQDVVKFDEVLNEKGEATLVPRILMKKGERFDPDAVNASATADNNGRCEEESVATTITRIADNTQFQRFRRGEIRVRHRDANIRMQYWKDPEATAASVKNGWFYTGDVGELDYGKLDDDGNPTLRIIDRVANMTELYINGDSVWVEQARLEAEVYANAAAADRICLLSDRNQPCLIAIVVPNKEFILKSAEALKIPLLSPRATRAQAEKGKFHYLCNHPIVKAAVLASLFAAAKSYPNANGSSATTEATSKAVKEHEIPGAVILDSDVWSSENGSLTLTGKPRRDKIRDKFIVQIEQAYAELSSEGALGAHGKRTEDTDMEAHMVIGSPSPPLTTTATTTTPPPPLTMAATNSLPSPPSTLLSLQLPATKRHDSFDNCSSSHHEEIESTNRAALVSLLASTWSAAPLETVNICLPPVLELSVELLQPLARILDVASKTIGPASVKDSGLPLGWGGYIQQNEKDALPFYPNSEKRDHIGFRFTCATQADDEEVNALLEEMREQVQRRRENFTRWTQEISEKIKAAEAEAVSVLQHHTAEVDRRLDELDIAVHEIRRHSSTKHGGHDVSALFHPLFEALTNRLVEVRKAYARCDEVAGEHPELKKSMETYSRASDKLRIVAPRRGVRIPPVIDLGGWFSASANSEDEIREAERASAAAGTSGGSGAGAGSGTLSQSLGDAKVWCSVSGELIERDLQSSGKPRYHCLDLQSVDRSLHSHELVQRITRLLNLLLEAEGLCGVENIVRLICRSYPINPARLSADDFIRRKGCLWTFEHAHFWHLRDRCEFPLVPVPHPNGWGTRYECVDTPASFISRACQEFANRIALGIPDPSEILFDPARPDLKFSYCPLAQAAQTALIQDRRYLWITYAELYRLAVSVAKTIRFYVPRGSFVGISGYNGIEWAVCDIACALAGCVSVGLHSTYDAQSAYHAITKADISLLFCAADLVYSQATINTSNNHVVTRAKKDEDSADSFWTVEKVLEIHAKHLRNAEEDGSQAVQAEFQLKNVILLDLSIDAFDRKYGWMVVRQGDKSVVASAPLNTSASVSIVDYLPGIYATNGVSSPVSVSSLVDLVGAITTLKAAQEGSAEEHIVPTPINAAATTVPEITVASRISQLELESPENQPADGRSSIFTILFTSGSTGQPKGVVVSAAGFFNDISSRNYVEPLVTVSYIPLSHSSDRLKMWEFLGNGGRVGFAHYSPSNWIDHETTKKSESLQSAGAGSNDVEGLFRQVARLQPTAMACPPNIWNGLYHLYREELKQAERSGKDKSAAEESARTAIAAMLGPRIKFLVTGGAPTAPEVIEFAKSLFPRASFADSYGATECGAITSNGVPIREKRIEIMLGPVDGATSETEGELWVHSPNMSIGYYKDDEQTRKSFVSVPDDVSADAGGKLWYKTGDLVRVLDKGRYVDCGSNDGKLLWLPKIAVLGRISAAVRLAGPDRVVVSPDILEGIYAVSPLLSQIFVHAQRNSRSLVAIVVAPRTASDRSDHLQAQASGRRSPATYDMIIEGDDEVTTEVKAEIQRVARLNGLRPADIPSAVYIERRIQWTHENGMLNASHKKSRAAFLKYYWRVLEELHKPFIVASEVL